MDQKYNFKKKSFVSSQFKEFTLSLIESLHNGETTIEKHRKSLTKFCKEVSIDSLSFEVELIHFVDLLSRFRKKSDKLLKKMIAHQAVKIYLKPEDIELFLPVGIIYFEKVISLGSGSVSSSGSNSYGLNLI